VPRRPKRRSRTKPCGSTWSPSLPSSSSATPSTRSALRPANKFDTFATSPSPHVILNEDAGASAGAWDADRNTIFTRRDLTATQSWETDRHDPVHTLHAIARRQPGGGPPRQATSLSLLRPLSQEDMARVESGVRRALALE
jgi:hypothetical protein